MRGDTIGEAIESRDEVSDELHASSCMALETHDLLCSVLPHIFARLLVLFRGHSVVETDYETRKCCLVLIWKNECPTE